MQKILVSACLLGEKVRYDGSDGCFLSWACGVRCGILYMGSARLSVQKILVSACLLGEKVRYDGSDCARHGILDIWAEQGRIAPLCPETAGGLSTPRLEAEIEAGNAEAVLQGRAGVRRSDGANISDAFLQGAEKALAECWKYRIKIAILKEGSPSCGTTQVNDGTFSGAKVKGQGVTARLLARHGISVFSEQKLDEAVLRLAELEVTHPARTR